VSFGAWLLDHIRPCDPGFAQSRAPVKEATPLESVTAVLNAFRSLALDEGDHNNLQGGAAR
jgi:hypothetical protein